MKKTLASIIALALALLLVAGCSSSGQYKDGEYEGSAQGNEGEIVVSVLVKGGKIDKIDITKQSETQSLLDGVIENTIPEIIEKQTTEGVDVLAGASKSSQGVIDAVTQALESAKKE
ncbi:FMN-binding protein [Paenibacillus thiaminolyticus]|uniref:FMN-binding protein n=1 Tax=Paenibacillus thiaminolyticus TaxID=49283 RepID=UPI001162A755|nr:FMN-binding protein [Paenibacillus thiaminolyticus]NGP61275.1 FMN-binding protein [Paenibacillus thiaminolyticus]